MAAAQASVSGRASSRAAETGEDLPPDRMVPVAERAPARHRVGAERAAAQHLVVAAEEHLRVLRYGNAANPGYGMKSRRRPLPHVADQLLHARAGTRPAGYAPTGAGRRWRWPRLACSARRVLVAPRDSGASGRSPGRTARPSPIRPRSAAAGRPSARTPPPRTSRRARTGSSRRHGSIVPNRAPPPVAVAVALPELRRRQTPASPVLPSPRSLHNSGRRSRRRR